MPGNQKKKKADILPQGVGLFNDAQQILCAAAWNISPPITPRKLRRVTPKKQRVLLL
jgi:hypothetical protein